MKKKRERNADVKDGRIQEMPSYRKRIFWVIGICMVIYPFLVYTNVEELSGKAAEYFMNTSGYVADFFLLVKERALVVFSVGMLLVFVGEHLFPDKILSFPKIMWKKLKVPALCFLGYLFCAVCSTLFAAEKGEVLWGICTEYEGILALIGYGVVFFTGYYYMSNEHASSILEKCIVLLMCMIIGLAFVEYFYEPVYEIDFWKYLIAPEKYRSVAESLDASKFSEQLLLSFYNPGYLGGACALLLPIAMALAIREERPKRMNRPVLLVTGLILVLLGSASTGALYASLFSCLCLCIIERKEFHKTKFVMVKVAACLVVFGIVATIFGYKDIPGKIQAVFLHESTLTVEEDQFYLKDLKLEDGILQVTGFEKQMNGEYGEEISFEITRGDDGDSLIFQAPQTLRGISYYIDDHIAYIDFGYEDTVDFYIAEEGLFLVGQNGALLSAIPSSEVENKQWNAFLTGRGYAWMNSVPIMKETIFLGAGPGNFVYEFPQWNVVDLMNTHGTYQILIDKPHNWYLQMWMETGMVSLWCIGCLFLVFFYRFIQVLGKGQLSKMETGMCMGILAFLITGMVNDSSITVQPLFWLFTGIAFGRNSLQYMDGMRK